MFDDEEELQQEAKQIAKRTMMSDDMEGYIEGAAFKILKLERELNRLRTNFYVLLFVLFVLPIFFRAG
jgi:hypothetical protein